VIKKTIPDAQAEDRRARQGIEKGGGAHRDGNESYPKKKDNTRKHLPDTQRQDPIKAWGSTIKVREKNREKRRKTSFTNQKNDRSAKDWAEGKKENGEMSGCVRLSAG